MVTATMHDQQQRQRWLNRLAPYESLAIAPAGGELARLRQEAEVTAEHAVAAEQRAERLAAQLATAQSAIDGATETADFTLVARALAEVQIVGRILAEAQREAHTARTTADQAATTLVRQRERGGRYRDAAPLDRGRRGEA